MLQSRADNAGGSPGRARLADLVVQVRVAVPVRLEGHQALDGGGAGRVQQRATPAKQLRQHLRLRQAQAWGGPGAGAGGEGRGG